MPFQAVQIHHLLIDPRQCQGGLHEKEPAEDWQADPVLLLGPDDYTDRCAVAQLAPLFEVQAAKLTRMNSAVSASSDRVMSGK